MIQTVWITNPRGETLELDLRGSQETEGLLIFNMGGLGAPKATVNGIAGPGFDGLRVNSVVTDPRHLSITLAVPPLAPHDEEAVRAKIYRYFPIKQMIGIRLKTDTRDVTTEGYVEQAEFNQFATVENVEISIVCPYPYLKNLLKDEVDYNGLMGTPMFSFPFSNEDRYEPITPLILFGTIASGASGVYVTYSGEVETGIDMTFLFNSHPCTYITVSNSLTGQIMYLDLGLPALHFGSVQTGDYIRMNTRTGEKSIWYYRGTEGYNMINSVGYADTWISLAPGNNYIGLDDDAGPGGIQMSMTYYPVMEGL